MKFLNDDHKLNDYFRFGCQLVTGWRTRHERWIANLRHVDVSPYLEGKVSLGYLILPTVNYGHSIESYGLKAIALWNRPGESSQAQLAGLRIYDRSPTLCERSSQTIQILMKRWFVEMSLPPVSGSELRRDHIGGRLRTLS